MIALPRGIFRLPKTLEIARAGFQASPLTFIVAPSVTRAFNSVDKSDMSAISDLDGTAASSDNKVTNGNVKPVLIDTDCGIDDAQAIILAAAHPDKVRIVALTTVSGNTSESNVFKNLKYLSKKLKISVPIFRGATTADDEEESNHASHCHGSDGLGDWPLRQLDEVALGVDTTEENESSRMASSAAIVHYANLHQGDLNLICLGPLTNLCQALKTDPHLGKKLNSCMIMGGNTMGIGNTGICSEFNFDFDVNAAKYVLENINCDSTQIVGWETCDQQTSMPRQRWTSLLRSIQTPISEFVFNIEAKKTNKKHFCDETAVCCFLFPEVIKEDLKAACTVETKGEFTRGMMVIDRRGHLKRNNLSSVVTKVDAEKLWQEMANAFSVLH